MYAYMVSVSIVGQMCKENPKNVTAMPWKKYIFQVHWRVLELAIVYSKLAIVYSKLAIVYSKQKEKLP